MVVYRGWLVVYGWWSMGGWWPMGGLWAVVVYGSEPSRTDLAATDLASESGTDLEGSHSATRTRKRRGTTQGHYPVPAWAQKDWSMHSRTHSQTHKSQ